MIVRQLQPESGAHVTTSALIAGLVTIATVSIGSNPVWTEFLQYDRNAILHGEIWRILSCHFTHCSVEHLSWDLVAFVTTVLVCEHLRAKRMVLCILLSLLAIPAALFVFAPNLIFYRGLSGVDSSLYIIMAAALLRSGLGNADRVTAICAMLAIIGFAVKLCYEPVTMDTIFVSSIGTDMVPVPLAHVIGAAVGAGIGIIPGVEALRASCYAAPFVVRP